MTRLQVSRRRGGQLVIALACAVAVAVPALGATAHRAGAETIDPSCISAGTSAYALRGPYAAKAAQSFTATSSALNAVDIEYSFDGGSAKQAPVTGELRDGGPTGALLATVKVHPKAGLVGPVWLRFTFATVQTLNPGATYAFVAYGPSISPNASINMAVWSTCADSYAGGTGYYSQHGVASDIGADLAFRAITDAAPTISIGDASVVEGDTGTRTLQFPVTLSQKKSGSTTVSYSVGSVTATGGAALGPDIDFDDGGGATRTLTFTNGLRRALISVPVFGDTSVEPDETLHVSLSAPSNGFALGRADATGTIFDDDSAPSGDRIGVGDAMVVRSRAGNQALAFPVTLSQPAASSIAVTWSVTDLTAHFGSAASTSDYGGHTSGGFTMPRGATQRTVTVAPIFADANPGAAPRTLRFTIDVSPTAVGVRSVATGTILPAWTGPNLPALVKSPTPQIGAACTSTDPVNGLVPGSELDIIWTVPTGTEPATGYIVHLKLTYPNEAPIFVTLPTIAGDQRHSLQCFPVGSKVVFSVASTNDAGTTGVVYPSGGGVETLIPPANLAWTTPATITAGVPATFTLGTPCPHTRGDGTPAAGPVVLAVVLHTGTQDVELFPSGTTFQLTFNPTSADSNATLRAFCVEIPSSGVQNATVIAYYTTNGVSVTP